MEQKTWEQPEQEYHLHQGEPYRHEDGLYTRPRPFEDDNHMAKHYDKERWWTVEAYDRSVIRRMREIGAMERESRLDGVLFQVDAKQLIEFIAAAEGLIVEFRTRRKRRISEKEKRRLAEMGRRNFEQKNGQI
jgi:hypothetical protein